VDAAGAGNHRKEEEVKKMTLYALVAAVTIPGILCIGNYVGSLTVTDPQAAFNRGQYRDAVRGFQRILEKKPDDTYTRVSLGLAYQAVGMRDSAMEAYKQAVLHNADAFIAARLAAELMARDPHLYKPGKAEWDSIEGHFNRAMTARSAAENLASYNEAEDVDERDIEHSLSALTAFLKAHPGDLASCVGLGFAHWRASNPGFPPTADARKHGELAAEQFRAALTIAPQDPLANFALVLTERAAAERDLEDGVSQSPHLTRMMEALQAAIRRLPGSALPMASAAAAPYTPEVCWSALPQVQGWARDHPHSATANFAVAWVYATHTRHAKAAAPGWDEKAQKPLKTACALAPRWKEPAALVPLLADARKRTRECLRLGTCIPGLPVKYQPPPRKRQGKPADK